MEPGWDLLLTASSESGCEYQMTTDSWYSPKARRSASEISPTVAYGFDSGKDRGHEIFGGHARGARFLASAASASRSVAAGTQRVEARDSARARFPDQCAVSGSVLSSSV